MAGDGERGAGGHYILGLIKSGGFALASLVSMYVIPVGLFCWMLS